MFDKITAARKKLRALHQGDPAHSADQELFGAFEETLRVLEERIYDLKRRVEALEKPK